MDEPDLSCDIAPAFLPGMLLYLSGLSVSFGCCVGQIDDCGRVSSISAPLSSGRLAYPLISSSLALLPFVTQAGWRNTQEHCARK